MRKDVGYYEDFFLIMSSKATHDKEGIVSFVFLTLPLSFIDLFIEAPFVSNRNITREYFGKPSSLSQTLCFSDSVPHGLLANALSCGIPQRSQQHP